MASLGSKVKLSDVNAFAGSTDMGNVSYEVPSLHSTYGIPTDPDVSQHHPRFAHFAGQDAAYDECIKIAKGMALLTLRVLTDPKLVEAARQDFDKEPDE
jgi:metal-dependent amidase/aminoacylase/carboxypeptidase family protein